jgi:hypothetical protein
MHLFDCYQFQMVGCLALDRQRRLAGAPGLFVRAGEVRATDSPVLGALELARRRRAAAEGASAPGRSGSASGVRGPDGPDATSLRGGEGAARGINCGVVKLLTKSENSFGIKVANHNSIVESLAKLEPKRINPVDVLRAYLVTGGEWPAEGVPGAAEEPEDAGELRGAETEQEAEETAGDAVAASPSRRRPRC